MSFNSRYLPIIGSLTVVTGGAIEASVKAQGLLYERRGGYRYRPSRLVRTYVIGGHFELSDSIGAFDLAQGYRKHDRYEQTFVYALIRIHSANESWDCVSNVDM